MKGLRRVKSSRINQLFFDLGLAVLLVGLSIFLHQSKVLQQWDNLIYDFESSLIKVPVDDNIVIVAIDDNSLQKLGRWPWSRAVHARFLDQLTKTDVAAIGFDILFMEPDLLKPNDDKQLLEAIKRNGRVVLPVLTNIEEDSIVNTKTLEHIMDAAILSHVNMVFDDQGVIRQFDLNIMLNNGEMLPSMAIALYRKTVGDSKALKFEKENRIFVAFSNPPGQFQVVSYADVLLDAKVRQRLKGKVVLVGVTAPGLGASLATPGARESRLMSGVEFHANALNVLYTEAVIVPLKWPGYWLISLLLIVIPVLTYRLCKLGMTLVLTLGFLVLTCISSFLLLSVFQLWFAPLSTLLCLILSYPLWSLRKLKQLNLSLFKEHENASAILKAIEESVIVTNKKGEVEYMNPAAEKMFACTLSEVKSSPFSELYDIIEQDEQTFVGSKALANNDKETSVEVQLIKNRYDEEYAVRFSSQLVYEESGLLDGTVFALSDLTEINNISRQNAFTAAHDALTGLPNRSLLQGLMEQAIKNATRESMGFAVLFIDLDGFKKINDAMGHTSGDFLLQEVANRLSNWARDSDTISRWGGDEFIIMLDKMGSSSDVSYVVEKIKYSLSQPYTLNNQQVFVTPSIGISLFPDDGEDVNILLEKADAAMYNVKESGRNNFCFYSQSLETEAKERLLLETELRQALKNNEFEVFFQPQVSLSSSRMSGMEALIRWKHSKKGILSPDQFIFLAEESGLIVPMGQWIVKEVCQQLKLWKDKELPLIKIAINISARQFAQKDLVSMIIEEIELHNIDGNLLQLEITESMIIQDINLVVEVMEELKAVGVSIAIDDFGTGYSSFEYLKKLPIDKLKIDKSFIANVTNNLDDASIVQAVIAMAHNMNMEVIAEGVETEEQVKFLLKNKCDYAQGYLFSKPLSVEKVEAFIKKFTPVEKA
ncbi:MAG: EAL domain-containing protein [Methylococcaceae bacterium]|nr:EAL domain-containing protein [Methylococcaceae bacterium]